MFALVAMFFFYLEERKSIVFDELAFACELLKTSIIQLQLCIRTLHFQCQVMLNYAENKQVKIVFASKMFPLWTAPTWTQQNKWLSNAIFFLFFLSPLSFRCFNFVFHLFFSLSSLYIWSIRIYMNFNGQSLFEDYCNSHSVR